MTLSSNVLPANTLHLSLVTSCALVVQGSCGVGFSGFSDWDKLALSFSKILSGQFLQLYFNAFKVQWNFSFFLKKISLKEDEFCELVLVRG